MGLLRTIVLVLVQSLSTLVFARVLMSWFRPHYRTQKNDWFFQLEGMVWRATEPLLAPIRNILPISGMGLDFSPLILLILVQLIGRAILSI